ncbi:MAG: response regulator [Treponema sp.]|jgi:putative two-component system response regulator|nr:response regulator [Treponema sp.]
MAIEKKKKVLLIDDDEIHLITADLFLKNDYEVHKVQSGNEALEYLTSSKVVPNIILLDIVMPNMSGWETFAKIKAIDSLKNVPIIFLTSIAEEEEKKRAYKIGVAGFITKPFNMTDLISEIKEVIRKHEIKK